MAFHSHAKTLFEESKVIMGRDIPAASSAAGLFSIQKAYSR